MIAYMKDSESLKKKEGRGREILARIEQACRDNDHDSVKRGLNDIESDELKRNVFRKIIDYYENEEARFPVGYVVLFIVWLLEKRDFREAGKYIERLNRAGVAGERISELVYEHVIKPDEMEYAERFKRNLEMLQKNKVLFSKLAFDFHDIKKKITSIGNYETYSEDFMGVVSLKKRSCLLVDMADMKLVRKILEAGNYLYLIYDDPGKFYYMLLFEDLLEIKNNIEKTSDETESVIFFAGRDLESMQEFFAGNMMTLIPQFAVVQPKHKEYRDILNKISDRRSSRTASFMKELKAYYKGKGHKYYQALFSKRPSDIKVLVITTLNSTLNKHISKSWHDSFKSLGYSVRLLIEKESYERMSDHSIKEAVCMFKPDVVFNINYAVNSVFKEKDVTDSLLWIMRYRDYNDINLGGFEYQNENMFFLPLFPNYADALKKSNVPENRIHYTVEGIDISVLSKSREINDKYACDIVSVNNAAGSELSRLELYMTKVDNKVLKGIMQELYACIEERAFNDNFLTEGEFFELLLEKSVESGYNVSDQGKQFFESFYQYITNSFFRRKTVEWILDAGITRNIKVWGGAWSNIDKFKKYHMGIAGQGHELSEIYGSSKISLSDTWGWNTHERNYEILASGGFPLVKSLSPEEQGRMDCISNHFKENEEIVLFDGKDDLLNKVQYYLDNPEERERIAGNGKNVVVENFSNIAIAGKTMDFIMKYYRGTGGKD